MTPLNSEIYENTKTYVKVNIQMYSIITYTYAYHNTI